MHGYLKFLVGDKKVLVGFYNIYSFRRFKFAKIIFLISVCVWERIYVIGCEFGQWDILSAYDWKDGMAMKMLFFMDDVESAKLKPKIIES